MNRILTSIKGSYSVAILRKIYNNNIDLAMIMCIQNLGSIFLFFLKILSKNPILMSIKGRNSLANLRKTMIYDTNIELSIIMCIENLVLIGLYVFKIVSKNKNLTSIKGYNYVANFLTFESSKLSCFSLLPIRMKKSQIKMKVLEYS